MNVRLRAWSSRVDMSHGTPTPSRARAIGRDDERIPVIVALIETADLSEREAI